MNNRFRLAAVVAAVLLAVMVGIVAYNAGVSHGQAIASTAAGAVPAAPVPPYYWYPYRPWGFGFAPLLFLFFGFFLFRILFWGGYHRRRRWPSPASWDFSPSFDEWHRRAHERMNSQPRA